MPVHQETTGTSLRSIDAAGARGDGKADRPLAVFDLDGTLVRRDTFLPFLISYGRRHRRWLSLLGMPLPVAAYAGRLMKDSAAKQRLIVSFLGGQPIERIEEHAAWFAEHWLERYPHEAALAELRRHQQAGDRVILLSASPSVYVPAIAQQLEIDEVVCTQVAHGDGLCIGRLSGANCKGEAKLQALKDHLKTEHATPGSHAYGDSHHDLPVLRWVEHGLLVRGAALSPVGELSEGNRHA